MCVIRKTRPDSFSVVHQKAASEAPGDGLPAGPHDDDDDDDDDENVTDCKEEKVDDWDEVSAFKIKAGQTSHFLLIDFFFFFFR